MKIVQAKRTGVQSLGRHSVGNTGFGGEEALAAAVVGEVAQAGLERAERIDKRQNQKTNLFMQKEDHLFWEERGGKDFFHVSELPPDIVTDGMKMEGRVSAAQVLPAMYRAHMEQAMENASLMIDITNSRTSWLANAKITLEGRMTKIQQTADSQIQKQILKDQTLQRGTALEKGRADIARQITLDMDIAPELMKEELREIDEFAEVITYRNMVTEQNIPGMREAVAFLEQPDKVYREKGHLQSKKRMSWAETLRSQIASYERSLIDTTTASTDALRRELKITTNNALKGYTTDTDRLADLLTRTIQANDKGSLDSEISDLETAFSFSVTVNNMNKYPAHMRQEYIDGDLSDPIFADFAPFEKDQLRERLQQSHNSLTSAENSDMMQSAIDTGFIVTDPVDIDPKDIDGTIDQLLNRRDVHDEAEARYGVSQGYFTKNEAIKLSSQFNSMNINEKLSFVGATSEAFGYTSGNVFEQLRVDGGANTLSVAGMATINGQASFARHIFKGDEERKADPARFKLIEPLIDVKTETYLGMAYRGNPGYRAAIKDSVKSAYISMALESGKGIQSLDNGGWFDDGIMGRALELATGGIIEHNGREIPPPAYGVTQDEFDDWINTIAPGYIDSLGGVSESSLDSRVKFQVSSSTVLESLRAGYLTLQSYTKQGEYLLLDRDGIPLYNASGVGMFVFKYDEAAPRVTIKTSKRFGMRYGGGR